MCRTQGTITYLSNLGEASVGTYAIGNNSWVAVGFGTGNNAGGYSLNSIQLEIADATGNPSGFSVMLYSSVSGSAILPGSSLGALDGPLDPSTAGVYTYTPPSNLVLPPSSIYFIVLTSGTAIADGAYEWSLAGTYSYNPNDGWGVFNREGSIGEFLSSQNGSSWIGNGGNFQFAITATAIPEPSMSWLLLLGSGVLMYVRRIFHR